jgi:hypothetical protein
MGTVFPCRDDVKNVQSFISTPICFHGMVLDTGTIILIQQDFLPDITTAYMELI